MRPESEAELAELVRTARGPLVVRGGGTRPLGPAPGEPLDVGALTGITLYEPGALTLVARAGTPLTEIEAELAREGQRLAFEPGDWRGILGTAGQSTIGGVMAANVAGPRRVQVGAARDALLGVRFVDGLGTVLRNGGRVMKNVTGYDLVKLLAGSRGRLGILTEVSLKVLPRPETAATLRVEVAGAGQAVAAMSAALTSPFDVTGAAWLPDEGVFLRIEGFAASVRYRATELVGRLKAFGEVALDEGTGRWAAIGDVAPLAGRPGDLWRIALRPSQTPEAVVRIASPVMLDWGGGLIWAVVPEGTDLRRQLGAIDGHATLMRAAPATFAALGAWPPEPPEIARLTQGLAQRFDPRGILGAGVGAGRQAQDGNMAGAAT